MKAILGTLLLTGSLTIASTAAFATSTTYQYCSTSGCRASSSVNVTSTYAATKYPIILAHGIMGFSSILGVDYFYGIGSDLTANGAKVFDTQVSSLDSSFVRGEQLRSQVQQILAITGAQKVNLIGHSQGALDSRYVAGVMPAQIASVTGVGGVNFGTPVADAVAKAAGIPVIGSTIAAASSSLLNAFFSFVGVASGQGYSQNFMAAINQLTTSTATTFNAQFPAGVPTTNCGQGVQKASNGVSYFSWGGTGVMTNFLDPLDYVFAVSSLIIPGASDGMVPQCSTHLGTVIRDNYYQNHGNEVNQVLGLTYIFAASPVTQYRGQANRLKNLGL
ncbi:MAG: triacylglycerol lipase [Gammaproteobacteria bacterium]|nr:triacylglycerol lipase [Gammaproteobacteria bacterium]